jgi:hypothetical protein
MVPDIIGWSLTAAAVAWGLTLSWASVAIARGRQAMQEEVDHWRAEAARAWRVVDQLRSEAAMWSRGRKDGREDLIAMMPLLVAAHRELAGPPVSDEVKADG